jgi:hypothetical protein
VTRGSQRRLRRTLLALVTVLCALAAAPFIALSAIALTSPYTTVVVPPACALAITPVAPSHTTAIPGSGSGTVIAVDGDRAVAVVTGQTPSPRPLAAYLLDRSGAGILWEVPLHSEAVVAAIDDGIVFLWDDKIGYIVSASTGEPLGAVVRSDNYRGIFQAPDGRRLQLDAEVTAIGLAGAIVSHRSIALAGVVDGCAFGL